jgi:HSP20 family protein
MEVKYLMSGEWKNKRKRPSFDIFVEFKEIEKIINEMMRQAYRKNKRFRPRVYVFSIRVGPDGRPRIRGFNNVEKRHYGPQIREQREPLVDVLDKEEEVVVVAELPNVEKEDIELYGTRDILTISVDKPQRKYFEEIEMPTKVNIKEAKVSYKNGVLEVTLPKNEEENVEIA